MSFDEEPLVLRKVIRHQIKHVFSAFASADAIGQWFAPHESIGTKITRYEFHEGGEYRMEFVLPGGSATSLTGTFQTISGPARLVFSFRWERPDPHADIDTLVTIDLIEKSETTEIVISHAKLKDEMMRERHNEGWQGTLSRLEEYLDKTEV